MLDGVTSEHPPLLIDIAKWPCNRAYQLLDLVRLAINIEHFQVNSVFQALCPTSTEHRGSSGNYLLSIGKVLCLPNIPRPINHRMMKVKVWVTRRGVKVCTSHQLLNSKWWCEQYIPLPGSPDTVKWPALCTPVWLCILSWNGPMDLLFVMRAAIFAQVASRWTR